MPYNPATLLPGEEFAIERFFRHASTSLSDLFDAAHEFWAPLFTPPHADGARWYCNPEIVSAIIIGAMLLLLALRFGGGFAKAAPRRIAKLVRRRRLRHPPVVRPRQLLFNRPPLFRHDGKLLFNRPPIFKRDGKLLFNRRPILANGVRRGLANGVARFRGRRGGPDYFTSAREILDARLEPMVGLHSIKSHLSALLDTLEMEQRRCQSSADYVARRGCMHMVFLGNPGTGKTAVAQLVACVLAEIGVLRKGHLVVAKKADLLGRYSNHVSRNTRAIVESAIGGVLLLDEAYALLQGEAELGREVLNVLVDLCYAHKDDLVVILAGYTHTMADLFEANPGLASRFPHKFAFDDYTVEELYSIANGMLVQASFVCADEEARNALKRLVTPIACENPCGNARSVENRIAAAITAQSSRLRYEQQQRRRQQQGGGEPPPTEREHSGDERSAADLFELTSADFDEAREVADRASAVLTPASSPARSTPPSRAVVMESPTPSSQTATPPAPAAPVAL